MSPRTTIMKLPLRFLFVFAMAALTVTAFTHAADPERPPMSLDEALKQLKGYDYDQPRDPLKAIEGWVGRSLSDPAQKRLAAERLAQILADGAATPDAKRFICGQLRLVGGNAQVPLLEKRMADAQTADAARRALAAIPGEASLKALRAVLPQAKGMLLVGVINSLGARRDAASIGALANLMHNTHAATAAAAARALGRIGTPYAAAALAKAKLDKQPSVLLEARLLCAQQLCRDGHAKAASVIYEAVWTSSCPTPWRIAALTGLVEARSDKALPALLEAMRSTDGALPASAMQLTQRLSGEAVTRALVGELDRLPPEAQALLIDVLGSRGGPIARGAIVKQLGSPNEPVKLAAVRALATAGSAASVDRLARLAANEKGTLQSAARTSLARLCGPGVRERLLAAAAKGEPSVRAELIRAMAARRTDGVVPLLLKAAGDSDKDVRRAALDALAALAGADAYPKLITLMVSAAESSEQRAAEKAAVATGARLPDVPARVKPVLAALAKANAKSKPVLLRVLGAFGGPQALEAVRAHLNDPDTALRDAAVRSLAGWPDAGAADDLLKRAKDADDMKHRVLVLRGYLRLAAEAQPKAMQMKMLERIRPIADTPDAKKMLLANLADVTDAAALHVAVSFLGDTAVQAEAAAATLKIAQTLVKRDPAAVMAAMEKVKALSKDKATLDRAAELTATAKRGPASSRTALRHNPKRSKAIKELLAKRAPTMRLACYLDCGPDMVDGGKPKLQVVRGAPYAWPDCESHADTRFGSVAYDNRQVEVNATSLDPKKHYQIGFAWWDYDHDARRQSVWAAPKDSKKWRRMLDTTKLPSLRARRQHPQENTLVLPPELYVDGALRLAFRKEGSVNAVLSEVWLWECDRPQPAVPAPKGMKMQPASLKKPLPQRNPNLPAPKDRTKTNVLIVTGDDLHNWRQTTPVLARGLAEDTRLEVQVLEDPNRLADAGMQAYDVAVLHFKDKHYPAPGPEAREGLRRFVADGKGLVVVHFACGAWQGWPEFVKIIGRVWNPKLRGHDPRGPFRVEITDPSHPITRGMQPFETTDELYTCLDGKTPIHLLAEAKSKVDGKMYPTAFVLTYGKGRVFHCALGHDVKALSTPQAMELFRRGAAWTAGLPPR